MYLKPSVRLSACCISLLATLAVACGEGVHPIGNGDAFSLAANDDGKLEYCTDGDDCRALANPHECAALDVTVDRTTGKTCERCVDSDGDVIYDDCAHSTVLCDVITTPDPDCVVCAHYEGPIVFSNCTVNPGEGRCEVYSDPDDGALCEVCYDASGQVTSRECQHRCEDIACPAIAPNCPEGTRPEPSPTDCCGFDCVATPTCDPAECPVCADGERRVYQDADDCCGTCQPIVDPPNCADVICTQDLFVCPDGTMAAPDPTDCCGYTCDPLRCELVLCPPPPDCKDGEHVSFKNSCCGECIPDDLQCELVDCAPSPEMCPDGSTPERDPDSCCGVICKPTGCPPVAPPNCNDNEELVEDPRDPCQGLCLPVNCNDVQCSAPPPECPAGQRLSFDNNCCGACVTDACHPVACPAFAPCPSGKVSRFVPDEAGCCDVQQCVTPCINSEACGEGEACAQVSDCLSCSDEPDAICPEVCHGACLPAA